MGGGSRGQVERYVPSRMTDQDAPVSSSISRGAPCTLNRTTMGCSLDCTECSAYAASFSPAELFGVSQH